MAVMSAAIDFANEVDRAAWRTHCMVHHAAGWSKEWNEKTSTVD